MRLTSLQARLARSTIVVLLAGLITLLGPSVRAAAAAAPAGHVYVLNNDLGGSNSITTFDRAADGRLTPAGVTSIGGRGGLAAYFDGTQGSLIRTPDGTRLFASDAGSNEISVVDVRAGQLTLHGVYPSGGPGPVSLTYGGGFLYVLNSGHTSLEAADVNGFRVDAAGTLQAIPGAWHLLSQGHPNPAQVQLDPSHRYLIVTEKWTSRLDLYRVGGDGSLTGPTIVGSSGIYPFGFAFNPAHPEQFLVTDSTGAPPTTGFVTAYRLTGGAVQVVGGGPVADYGVAPCWMVITRDGRFAYVSNADGATISGFRIGAGGAITLLNTDGVTARTPPDTFPLEEGLTRDSRFLYVLESRLLLPQPGAATLSGWRIGSTGALTSVVDPAGIQLPFSAIGLAAD